MEESFRRGRNCTRKHNDACENIKMHRMAARFIALREKKKSNGLRLAVRARIQIALNKTRPAMSSANSHSRRWLHVAAEGATLWEFHLQSGGVELKTC